MTSRLRELAAFESTPLNFAVMARECRPPRWVLHPEAKFAGATFFDQKRKRHLGGLHSRAMTSLFVILTVHALLQRLAH
jgi:hypothetical protein